MTGPDKNENNYDRLWNIKTLSDQLSAKFYNPSEHLPVDEVTVLFKGRVIFKQYIQKKCKQFGIKIYKLCDTTGYTHSMNVYLGKDRQNVRQMMTYM
jgi:hypothetical protein